MTRPTSNEFNIKTNAGDQGSNVSVAGHGDGTFLVTWTGNVKPPGPDDEGPRYYAEILGRTFSLTTSTSSVFVVNTELRDPQFSSTVEALADGSYVVAYSSGIEDQLYGTFVPTQVIGSNGEKIGIEFYPENYSYYHLNPDITVLASGDYIVSYSDEYFPEFDIRNVAGSYSGPFHVSFSNNPLDVATAALSDGGYVIFWQGFESEEIASEENPAYGLWAQRRSETGIIESTFLLAPLDSGTNALVEAQTLGDGNVVMIWTAHGGPNGSDVRGMIFDPQTGDIVAAPFTVNVATAGNQSAAEIALLEYGHFVVVWQDSQPGTGDNSGSAIRAQVFDGDGNAVGGPILVNQQTAGSQLAPSVASVGGSNFVVSWHDFSGVKARLFDAGEAATPTSALYTRPGTQDGTLSENQRFVGPDGPNTFFISIDANSGTDRIVNFAHDDILLTDKALADANGDGFITFGKNKVLDMDNPGSGTDGVRTDGVGNLRYLGTRDGLFAYGDGSVRPTGAVEGTLSSDALKGDRGDAKTDLFFFDTALGIGIGSDRIERFGNKDIIVTTRLIADVNDDRRIDFGSDKIADFGDGDLRLTTTDSKRITALELDGTVVRDGVAYHVYSKIGSSVGVDALQAVDGPALYFTASGPSGLELYRPSQGSTTPVLIDIILGADSSTPNGMFKFGDNVYPTAMTTTGSQLHRVSTDTDGVQALNVRVNFDLGDRMLGTELGGKLYVSGLSSAAGGEVFSLTSSATAATAVEVVPGAVGVDPNVPFAHAGKLFFDGYSSETGQELYRYDPTTDLFTRFDVNRDGEDGPRESSPRDFTSFNNALYFIADTQEYGRELHQLVGNDLTVIDIDAAEGSPSNLTGPGNTLYSSAETLGGGRELMKLQLGSDTVLLAADLMPGPASSSPQGITAFDGDLVFVPDTAIAGRELHRLDGSTGAVSVFDLGPGPASSQIANLQVFGDVLYFIAETAAAGRELYRWSDNASAPVLIDIKAGAGSTFDLDVATSFAHDANTLYFLTVTDQIGRLDDNSLVADVAFSRPSLFGFGELLIA